MVDDNDISLRDYFAAKALQALLQNSASLDGDNEFSFDWAVACGVNAHVDLLGADDNNKNARYSWAQYYAEEAYEIADAMMQARKRPK